MCVRLGITTAIPPVKLELKYNNTYYTCSNHGSSLNELPFRVRLINRFYMFAYCKEYHNLGNIGAKKFDKINFCAKKFHSMDELRKHFSHLLPEYVAEGSTI